MKRAMILLLALLMCGCAPMEENVQTKTVQVLAQSTTEIYLNWDYAKEELGSTSRTLYAYDRNGNCVEKRQYSDEELVSKWKYAYDDAGNQTLYKYYDCTGLFPKLEVHTEYVYDDQGRVLESIDRTRWWGSNRSVTTYDENGKTRRWESSDGLIEEYIYEENATITQQISSNGTVTEYRSEYDLDESGNTIAIRYYINGVLDGTFAYAYDDQGRMLNYVCQDSEGQVITRMDYSYDDSENSVTIHYLDGSSRTSFYDDQGNEIRTQQWDEEGNLESNHTYTYREIKVPVS